MSCPCFSPREPRSHESGPQTATLPLGDSFAGLCLSQPDAPTKPDDSRLPLCNLGYARGECPRFPSGPGPDAVRFAISSDDGLSLQIYYVLEQGHHPLRHGLFAYGLASREFQPPPESPLFRAQAEAYVASYLRRKGNGVSAG